MRGTAFVGIWGRKCLRISNILVSLISSARYSSFHFAFYFHLALGIAWIDRRRIEREYRNVRADLDGRARITGFNYESRENFDELGETAGGD